MERLQWGSVRVDNALWLKPVLEKTGSAAAACSPFKINTEKFSDPSSRGQSTFCFKLIGAAGWLRKLIFLRRPTDDDVAIRFETGRVLFPPCFGQDAAAHSSNMVRAHRWPETFLSSSISQNSQMCVIAAASHPLQIRQTPWVTLQIPRRHFQTLHGLRESFHMTAVQGKSEDRSSFTSTLPSENEEKKKKQTDIVV